MPEDAPLESHHAAIHWFFLKWPKWVKVTSAVVGVLGTIGTVMGFGGTIVNAIHSRDIKMQAEAVAKELDKQHDAKTDTVLEEHGKQIQNIQQVVQGIDAHLGKQDVELLGTKEQLNRIETAIVTSSGPRPISIAPTPH